jgi:hypothetical protein
MVAPTVYIVQRPTGFEVDVEINDDNIGIDYNDDKTTISSSTSTESDSESSSSNTSTVVVETKQQRYYKKFSDYYDNARKNASVSTARKPVQRTFVMTCTNRPPPKYNQNMHYTRVVISSTVTEIPARCFYNWTSLVQIILEYPSQCKVVGENAFYGCRSLQNIDFDTANQSLHVIESNAFGCCDSLQSVVVPEGVKIIEDMAFFGCDQLQNLQLPVTLREIHQHGKSIRRSF